MHLLEQYGLISSSKISSPFIYQSYINLPETPYITFQAQSLQVPSKNYSYWGQVLAIIIPVLQKHGISIVQIGVEKEVIYQNVISYVGQTNHGQLAYLINNSLLHFGPDSLGIHIASGYNIPIVGLYSNIQSGVAGPYWGDKDKQILFDAYKRVGNGKPSYSNQENPKSIDTIMPEEIASAILKLLKIDFEIPFKTVYIGKNYTNLANKINEIIPNAQIVNYNNPNIQAEIRMDINFDEESLAKQLQILKGVIFTNKPINLQLLKALKPNILSIIYEITNNDNPEFVNNVKKLGINVVLYSKLSKEEINNKKINYYEFGKINEFIREENEKIIELKKDIGSLYYMTNKFIVQNGKVYSSESNRLNDIVFNNDYEFQKAIDCPEFWNEDLMFSHIIKKI